MTDDQELFDYLKKVFAASEYDRDVNEAWVHKNTNIELDDEEIRVCELEVSSEHLGEIEEFKLVSWIDNEPIVWAGCYNDEYHSEIVDPNLFVEFKLKMVV